MIRYIIISYVAMIWYKAVCNFMTQESNFFNKSRIETEVDTECLGNETGMQILVPQG